MFNALPKKTGRDLALAVAVEFERRINAFDELQIVAQVLCERIDVLVDRRVVELYVERLSFGRLPVFGEEQRKSVGVQVVHALERRTRADRPGQRPDLNLQLALDLVEQVERVLARRSSLLTKTMTGVLRIRHTSINLRVCVSTPLAPSITMITLSTAVSVR